MSELLAWSTGPAAEFLQALASIWLVQLACIVAQLPDASCCHNKPGRILGHVLERHHGYLGALALVPFVPLQLLALVCLVDDLYQHARQLWGDDPFYKSPLHTRAAAAGVIAWLSRW